MIAAAGPKRRDAADGAAADGMRLPDGLRATRASCLPGVLAVQAPAYRGRARASGRDAISARPCGRTIAINGFPLVVLVDDSEFAARTLNNFLWVTFTRSNPGGRRRTASARSRDRSTGAARARW